MKLLIHSPNEVGGLAEHTHYQARAFARAGVDVTVLCPAGYATQRKVDYPIALVYSMPPIRPSNETKAGKIVRIAKMALTLLRNQWRLAWEILHRKPDAVLFDSYVEYLAPLWVWPHVMLSRLGGVTYVANLHDPVRDFQVGPAWWHRLSVVMGYWPLEVVVVHQHLEARGPIPKRVRVVEAPVGVYELPAPTQDVNGIRKKWQVTDADVVFLSFGFIRDNKNVDLLIRSLAANPSAVLVVMGKAQSSTQRPLSFYQDLAAQLGVEDRVRFRGEFVPDEDLGSYFAAADFIAITYSKEFHSQSGVLNMAADARKVVLASAGESPLKNCVERFRLGEFVEPDSVEAMTSGMARLCARVRSGETCSEPDWDGYGAYASWGSNARIITDAIGQNSRTT